MLSTTFSSASFSSVLVSIPKDADSPSSNAVSAQQRQIRRLKDRFILSRQRENPLTLC